MSSGDTASAAEPDRRHRRIGLHRDAEAVRHLPHVARADVERQLRVDGVVGLQRRARHRLRAVVRVVVRVHVPRLRGGAPRPGRARERRRRVVRRVRIGPLLDRRREHERLERRAGLARRLRSEVELVPFRAHDGRHGADRAGARLDRDNGRRGIRLVRQDIEDRLLREALQTRIDRRVDLEPALAHGRSRRTGARAGRSRTRRSTAA